jgi:hypothetical protein
MELIGPYLIGCVLLTVAGVMKAARPDDTARALVAMVPRRLQALVRFPVLRLSVRVISGMEAGLGLTALLVPRPLLAALVAGSYILFAGVVTYARARGGALASCGCFGTPDTPATYLHAGIDLLLAGSAALGAANGPRTGWLGTVLAHQPLGGVPLIGLSAIGAAMTYLTLSGLTRLQGVRLTLAASDRTH